MVAGFAAKMGKVHSVYVFVTPVYLARIGGEGTRLGTHLSRVPKRVLLGPQALRFRPCLAEPVSQPPTLQKFRVGGWEVKQVRNCRAVRIGLG